MKVYLPAGWDLTRDYSCVTRRAYGRPNPIAPSNDHLTERPGTPDKRTLREVEITENATQGAVTERNEREIACNSS